MSYRYSDLLRCVSFTKGDSFVRKAFEINGNAEGATKFVSTGVAPTDGVASGVNLGTDAVLQKELR